MISSCVIRWELKIVTGKFGFTFKMKLSTRPEKYLGEIETWDRAEARLKEALDKFNGEGKKMHSPFIGRSMTDHTTRRLGAQPWRRRLLRSEDRHHHLRRT